MRPAHGRGIDRSIGERRAWIALGAVDGVGDARFGQLIGAYGGAEAVLEAAGEGPVEAARRAMESEAKIRLDTKTMDNIRGAGRDPLQVERRMAELDVWALTPLDSGYPARLRELDPAPAVALRPGRPGRGPG